MKKEWCVNNTASRTNSGIANGDLPFRRIVVRVGKVLDPLDHLRRSEAVAISLNIDVSGTERIWHQKA